MNCPNCERKGIKPYWVVPWSGEKYYKCPHCHAYWSVYRGEIVKK